MPQISSSLSQILTQFQLKFVWTLIQALSKNV